MKRLANRMLFGLLCSLNYSFNALAADPCSMGFGPRPDCFHSRIEPRIRITLVAYGSTVNMSDLLRLEKLFTERFESATEKQIRVEFVDRGVLPLADYPRDLASVRTSVHGDESRRTLERLTRLWYYHELSTDNGFNYERLTDELHSELKKSGLSTAMAESDLVLALSGPQFEGLGFADGGMGLVEHPNEVAWGTSDGGWTSTSTDEQLVDELLHETGHLLGLNHASGRCFSEGMSGADRMRCCQTSPGSQDVMSYCRDRSRVRGPYYYRYTSCTKDYLFTKTIPALLQGGARPTQEKPCD